VPDPGTAPHAVARSGVDDLAAAAAGHVDYGDDGMATIDFASGGTPAIPAFSTAPVTVSREVADVPAAPSDGAVLGRALVDAPAAPTPAVTGDGATPANDNPTKGPDADEIYEEVIQRLRRDLVAELEQQGHLLRDTF
jgi:hypothetical protein